MRVKCTSYNLNYLNKVAQYKSHEKWNPQETNSKESTGSKREKFLLNSVPLHTDCSTPKQTGREGLSLLYASRLVLFVLKAIGIASGLVVMSVVAWVVYMLLALVSFVTACWTLCVHTTPHPPQNICKSNGELRNNAHEGRTPKDENHRKNQTAGASGKNQRIPCLPRSTGSPKSTFLVQVENMSSVTRFHVSDHPAVSFQRKNR